MATQFDTQLQQLYVAYFNRPADPSGLAFYADKLATNATTMAAISASFAASTEYRNEYSQNTNAGVVTKVYENLFGHGPDAAGLALYTEALNNRTMTVDQMVTWISGGALGADKVAFESKVAVAVAFTNAVNTPEEIAGYNVAAAQTAAKEMLADIKTAADATAAVAAIDTKVAETIKAGVEFTLATGLADLDAATTARAEFLESFGEENDIENADAASVATALQNAKNALATEISNPAFANASAGVQAALIADQVTANNATLTAANAALKTAQDNVAKVAGLNTAIAASTSAQTAAEDAQDAALDADIALTNAQNNFTTRNATVTATGTIEGGNLVLKTAAGVTIAEMKDGEFAIPSTVTAANYAGLTAYVAAVNASVSADADLVAATDAATLAQLQVELLDLEGTSVPTGSFTFTETATPAKITYASIVNELSALTAASLTENTAAAREALADFRGQISAFIEANDTPLADAVARAQQGTLAQAQAAVDAIDADGLAAAVIAQQQYDAAVDLQEAAVAAYDDEAEDFTTGNATLTINADDTVNVSGANGAAVVSLVDGEFVAAQGADEATYPGLDAYILAANAVLTANANVTAAELTTEEETLISDNAAAVLALQTAQANAASSTAATRAAALGVEGAQDAIDDLAEAQADLATAQAAADELKSLDEAVKAATDAFAANDYVAPMMLGVSAFGTTGSDIFVATDVNSTIANFGRSGEDVLFVGSNYTHNTGALTTGNDAVLEVFFTQRGANTIVTIESKAYGSDSGDVHTVTLTGVNATDLNFENGIISL
jgi:hypothetical protein